MGVILFWFPYYPSEIYGNVNNAKAFKIEANGNKLNIKDNEELIVIVFAPKKGYEGNSNLDLNHPSVEIKGYIDQMKSENIFSIGQGF